MDPFQNVNDKSCRDFTRKELQHMVLCAVWQKQRNSLRQRTESFYIQRLHILGSHKQHVTSKKMRAFARFKGEFWCMDLAYVAKLAKGNGVKYLLVRQDLFDRAVDAKGMKTKDSKETGRHFQNWLPKKVDQTKFGYMRGQNLLESSRKFAALKEWNILHNEWHESSICRTHNTLTQKHFVSLHGGLWVQVYSWITSNYCNNEV